MKVALSRRLVLEAPARVPDGAGGYGQAWTALGTLWAEVRPDARSGADLPGGAHVPGTLRITVRAAPEGAASRPVPGQRLREGGRAYAVVHVREADPRGRFLRCTAVEAAP